MKTSIRSLGPLAVTLALVATAMGCTKKPVQTPDVKPAATATPVPVATKVTDPGFKTPTPTPTTDGGIDGKDPETINKAGYLQPVFFEFNKSDITEESRKVLSANADFLKKYSLFKLNIEGHCDERGTEDYNMALGERRANAARDYLKASGVAESRMHPVSLGESRPFEKGHDEAAWAKNRRAHFVVTSTK